MLQRVHLRKGTYADTCAGTRAAFFVKQGKAVALKIV